ncbi:MAG: MiaB/RimO family radical SAM methylthiotransferase, partial [Kiritimatiellaeota bacterium]|nr:MiaB/RimO family radical SAM methylthiotransferase [Kiritimatiellota bacterium]
GRCRAVVVAGCMSQRYRDRLFHAFPNIDAILGVDDLDALPAILAQVASGKRHVNAVSTTKPCRTFAPRQSDLVLTGGAFAYLKIGEGCRHACAYCAIPLIRGRYRSRPQADLVREARCLVESGIREICVIAQDTTAYGSDLKDGASLVSLLAALDTIEGDFWIRLLYAYPSGITDDLLDWMAQSPHACRYLDIPLQHSHPDILRAMRRADTVSHVETLVPRLRAKVPDITLRTTFLVGFPGENDDHFLHLRNYMAHAKFDHVGVFAYSPEEGTAAFAMEDAADDVIAESRRDTLLQLQATYVAARLAKMKGRETTLLLEAPHADDNDCETGLWVARSAAQAPEDIDGVTLVANLPPDTAPGGFLRATITGHSSYDLLAEPFPKRSIVVSPDIVTPPK